MVDQQQVKKAVESLIVAIGEDLERDGLRQTPERVSQMYVELFSGMGIDPGSVLKSVFDIDSSTDPVFLKNIPFSSICEHHMLPFFGNASIGYVPNGNVPGISKIARAIEIVSRRLQIQERLTSEIADAIYRTIKPHGLAVLIEAEHLCMSMRGVKKYGSTVTTFAVRGKFGESTELRSQLINLLRDRNL